MTYLVGKVLRIERGTDVSDVIVDVSGYECRVTLADTVIKAEDFRPGHEVTLEFANNTITDILKGTVYRTD
jgi:predicted ABC-class ATPase